MFFVQHGNSGSDQAAFAASVLIGVTNLVFTLLALHSWTASDAAYYSPAPPPSCALALLLLAFQLLRVQANFFLIVGSTMLYVAAFATGLGPGAWVYMAEIFPTNVRGRAMSISTAVLWLSCILVSNTFLSMVHALTAAGAYFVYAGICAVAAVFFSQLPETRGRSLEEIEQSWKH